jgi:xanthine dehydrogenase YagT iron-sulfur-binding subunit
MPGTSNDSSTTKSSGNSGWSRRHFLKGVGAAAIATDTILQRVEKAGAADAVDPAAVNTPISGSIPITLNVNGQQRQVTVEPRTTLVSALRDRLDPAITGPKIGCNMGTCGACTVILNGKTAYGCSVLAIDAVGKEISTVEGFGTPQNMSPVQAAMVEKDGMMCGFCTSGFITSITCLLRNNPDPTIDQVKEGCKGNFCRCGSYPHLFEAALTAAKNGGGRTGT